MSVVVLAYQEVGHACLKALLEAGADVRLVLTHEDDPGEEIWFSSVADLAASAGLQVLTPAEPHDPEILARVEQIRPDFIFSFYYRHLLRDEFLSLARRGAYNLHGSLLPRYRGRVPVNWALIHGETETGVTLHRMIARPDAGDIAAQKAVPIAPRDTVRELYAKIVEAAGQLMTETWPLLSSGRIVETPQDESLASVFRGRRPEDGRIVWDRPAREIYNLCRAVTHPYPGAFTFLAGRKLFVWAADFDSDRKGGLPGTVLGFEADGALVAATGSGALLIRAAAWEGGPEISGDLSGLGLKPGDRFEA